MYKMKATCELHAPALLCTYIEPSAPVKGETWWAFRTLGVSVVIKNFLTLPIFKFQNLDPSNIPTPISWPYQYYNSNFLTLPIFQPKFLDPTNIPTPIFWPYKYSNPKILTLPIFQPQSLDPTSIPTQNFLIVQSTAYPLYRLTGATRNV